MRATGAQKLEPYLVHLRALPFVRKARVTARSHALVLEIRTPTDTAELPVELRQSNLSRLMVDALAARKHAPFGWIILAAHVGRGLGRELVERRVNFVDLSGNCYLRLGDQYCALVEGRLQHKQPKAGRGMGVSGHRALFAILADPTLLDAPVRTLAQKAGVGKTVVAEAVASFQREGLIGPGAQLARVLEPQALLDRWLAAYASTVRPRLFVGAFRTQDGTPQELEARVEKALSSELQVVWGWSGGAAAMRLAGQYRGEKTVLCLGSPLPDLPRRLRALSDDDGPFVVLGAPGPLAFEGAELHTVHPLLVYSELLVSGDPRAREAAREIRERYLGQLR